MNTPDDAPSDLAEQLVRCIKQLEKYSTHDHGCAKRDSADYVCTCGLTDLLVRVRSIITIHNKL